MGRQGALTCAGREDDVMTVDYMVPNPVFVAQDKRESCWYAAAQMLIRWRRNQDGASNPRLVDPSEHSDGIYFRDQDQGLPDSKMRELARVLGLRWIPPMSPSPELVGSGLRRVGPLYVNCMAHAIVIVGIRSPLGPVRRSHEVRIHDPSPRDIGRAYWRSLAEMFQHGNLTSDAPIVGAQSNILFLYCPPSSRGKA